MRLLSNVAWALAAGLLLSGITCSAAAGEAEVRDVLTGLDNPSGLAVQPGTGEVFVSDSGAGRVVRVNPKSGGEAANAITGFSIDIYGKGPMYNIGPLGLAFLNKNNLVVGGGDLKDGSELARIYNVSGGKAQKVDDAKHKLGPIAPGEASKMGEGNFYGVAASSQAVYFSSNGDDTKGWVLKIAIEDNTPGELTPFIATKVATEVDAPVGITLSSDGHLVVGQMGEINVPTDSLLTVYDPKSGDLKWKAETGLFDIAGLAYSPKSKKLYAVDFAWMDTTQGGLFRLDVTEGDGGATVEAVKIASLDKPTALTFDAEGNLFVTIIGTAEEGSQPKPGKLVQVMGDF